ncbi:MAG: hypothetical protein QM697_05455 [Lachnospiraceae bacterium]
MPSIISIFYFNFKLHLLYFSSVFLENSGINVSAQSVDASNLKKKQTLIKAKNASRELYRAGEILLSDLILRNKLYKKASAPS